MTLSIVLWAPPVHKAVLQALYLSQHGKMQEKKIIQYASLLMGKVNFLLLGLWE